jgi:hypothetical protein
VDLIIVLVLLVLLQCLAHLPDGVTGFVRIGSRVAALSGPRWWIQSPLPWSVAYVGARPLVLDAPGGGLRPRSSARHPLLGSLHDSMPGIRADQIRAVEARGAVVVLDGAAFVRCPDEPSAERLADVLRPCEGGPVTERLAAAARASCALQDLETARAELDEMARPLALGIAAYAALLLVVVPAAVGWLGSEAALHWLWLPVLIAHVGSFATLVLCARRVGLRHGRLELLLPALLYPPALLRAHSDLGRIQLARFHPAAFAVHLLARREALAFLRHEIARLRHPRAGDVGGPIARAELAGLRDLLAGLGISEPEILAPPEPRGPGADRYCPICLDEFTAEGERCRSCDVALEDYPSDHGLEGAQQDVAR